VRISRNIASALICRIRRRAAFTVSASFITAAVFAAVPATASTATTSPAAVSATTTPSAAVSAAAASPAVESGAAFCADTPPPPGLDFWRCDGTTWVGISCSNPSDNNADTNFTVIYAENNCNWRTWLHQYTSPLDGTEGWSFCISPTTVPVPFQELPAANQDPENIQVTSNETPCPGTASPPPPPAGYTPITTQQGMCLDDENGWGRDGWPVQLWTCTGNPNQAWQVEPDGTIRNANSWCLGTGSAADGYAGTADGTGLVMVACSGNYDGSYWTRSPSGGQIVNKYADAAMDNNLGLQQDGNAVQLSGATTGPESQDWTAVPSGGGNPVVTPGNPPALHTDGANMVTSAGQVFVPRGFTLSALEYTTPYLDNQNAFTSVLSEMEAQLDALAGAWHGNIVRLQIEQDGLVTSCTPATGPAPGTTAAVGVANTAYLTLIQDVVTYAQEKGLVVVLNAQTETGSATYGTQDEPMPTDNTECFWQILRPYYGNDASVIIDPFNEPRAIAGLTVAQYMALWKDGGAYPPNTTGAPTYKGFEELAEYLRKFGYATNMLWVEPPASQDSEALAGLTDGDGYLLNSDISNVSYSFHHPTTYGYVRSPANWDAQFGDLVRLDQLSVNDGEWNTRSYLNTDPNAKPASNTDSGPCWNDAPTAVPQYFAYLQNLGVGLTAWTMSDGGAGLGMTAASDPGTFTTTANMTGWPTTPAHPDGVCENLNPTLGPGALLMAWFGQQAGS
jgi:hypothetical protein